MGFGDRIKNTLFYYINQLLIRPQFIVLADQLRKEHNIAIGQVESQSRAGIVVLQQPSALDFPHPLVPAMKPVGPLLAEPGRPLPAVGLIVLMQSA